ncbi:MAG TPA: NAD(P)/FAD-dependent oxidoreductase, partial [Vicinamibacteria bacterium]|nr:NAD(P)/FAD-dependent oxidoreductase [Vicinamibacteria bacterium]
DAIVVGGGPAGSTLAGRLHAGGLDVLVLDRAVFPRDKLCAGWITPGVVEALALDLEEYGRSHVLQPITRFRTGVIGARAIETDYGRPVSYGILRSEFDDFLLRRSGAPVLSGVAVDAIERAEGRWIVNGGVRTPLLVGAGGHFCPVARRLGARRERDPVVVAQEVEWPVPSEQEGTFAARGDTPELYFSPDLKGYGWCFRKGDRLNVGLGRLDAHGLGAHIAVFREFLRAEGRVPADLPARWKGHAYLLYERERPRIVDDGALLVGDAAGLAYAASGEGIRPAVESGLMAARTILAARKRYGREDLAPYDRVVRARFGGRRAQGSLPLPPGLVAAAGRTLFGLSWFTRRIVLDRWFLHAGQPAWDRAAPTASL